MRTDEKAKARILLTLESRVNCALRNPKLARVRKTNQLSTRKQETPSPHLQPHWSCAKRWRRPIPPWIFRRQS